MTEDEKREYVAKHCTLNGNPAKISGVKSEFAAITELDTLISFQYSWYTVKRIMDNKQGKFKS